MNVYDFDHTIYRGDCTIDFWRYCLEQYPKVWLTIPEACIYALAFMVRLCSRERFKENFYHFLRYVPDTSAAVDAFWNSNSSRIAGWYLEQQQRDDLVISASPDFLISEICKRLRVYYISSAVDPITGKLLGPNCRGTEKLRQFRTRYPNGIIELFYSDSQSDVDLARESQRAYLVKGENRKEWIP